MYIPSYYQIKDLAEIENFVKENAFAILVSNGTDAPFVTHIPLELYKNEKEEWLLRGHIARANPHAERLSENSKVLTIFQGAHHYISASWYSAPNVSTWNFQAVHIYGSIRILSEAELLTALNDLTNKYEAISTQPMTMNRLSEKMISSHVKEIMGFEIKVESIQAKYKLSQNRNKADHENITKKLEQLESPAAKKIATEMKRTKRK